MQKLLMSDSIRHNGHRKRPAFNAGEIDEDKGDLGIAGHRYPERELCRYGRLAPDVASTGQKNPRRYVSVSDEESGQ